MKRGNTFHCKRCGFASAMEMQRDVEIGLFPCPVCRRVGGRAWYAFRELVVCGLFAIPVAFVTFVVVMMGAIEMNAARTSTPHIVTVLVVAVTTTGTLVLRWNKAHREAKANVQLRRYWEWQLPAGPRVIAAQDPSSGDDAVWIDGIRAAASEEDEGYPIALQPADGDPYRTASTQAKVVFPADGTCWLMLGGKRIEPVRTSPDVV